MKTTLKNIKGIYGVMLLCSVVFLIRCGNPMSEQTQQAVPEDSTAQFASENQVAETPDVTFRDENGKIVRLKDLRGKVVFINFWATWCGPCVAEMPSIDQLKATFKGSEDIVFMLVDVDGDLKRSKSFMAKNKYNLPVFTAESAIPSDYLGGAIPTTVVLDKKGELVVRAEGGRDYMSPGIKKALTDLVRMPN
ncbi:TlpA family protein disulfide reductase [Sphingobacterium psychroaquaticum]|uniref:TlpA family protein disulfide reductase n=1 Tax=Sphingobacterium psychroaquaticum TaxID=561061 RepID=UPI0010696C56|nr:TlpA disulfide reductase family protein [Sphingobacterium psychroaquaticum]QBQ41999.1 TlpA family protein disulfide reductase [Sphingobacterium psychroaquaticum]